MLANSFYEGPSHLDSARELVITVRSDAHNVVLRFSQVCTVIQNRQELLGVHQSGTLYLPFTLFHPDRLDHFQPCIHEVPVCAMQTASLQLVQKDVQLL